MSNLIHQKVNRAVLTGIMDLDSIIHIIANVQFSRGNRDNVSQVEQHVARFMDTIIRNSGVVQWIGFYQGMNHKNFRTDLLPEYKGHRTKTEAILLWKPTILATLKKIGVTELFYIESDDALAVVSRLFSNYILVSADKDMVQIPGTHYNPFKKGPAISPDRWKRISKHQALFNLYCQVLSGDSTDMPNELCGIPLVGEVKSKKFLANAENEQEYLQVVHDKYVAKFGDEAGLKRALVTYQMVRLLTHSRDDWYANDNAHSEMMKLTQNIDKYIVQVEHPIQDLFPVNTTLLDLLK
jgi:5'-3' exonuclease